MKTTLKILYGLLFLLTAFWLAAGFYMLFKEVKAEIFWPAKIIAILMIGNAFIFLVLAWGVWKKKKWLFYPGLIYLAINVILSIADQLGFWDFVGLGISLITLIFFYKAKAVFKETKPA
ncbi:MAG: hypothetical protein WC528_04120 [Patescibacteria group bacterium]